ncbi:H-NS histone family protein [Vibrio ordalii]|uniref:H-NS histone family protein n=1 Tax=Vibrio ordalii TaxID=28174 RepID=UPI0002483726|nr:H-NS histone family protein [Vibrio ordalii]
MRLDNNLKNITLALEDSSIEEVSAIIEKMTAIKSDLEKKVNTQRFENKSSLKNAVRQLGDESLVITFKDSPHQKFSRPPKYQYVDEDGIKKTWWGGGKMPLALRKAITNSDGIEDKNLLANYLIPKSEGRYQYKDKDGNACLWDGEGKPPRDLQTLLNNGFALEDFATDKKAKSKPLIVHPKGSAYRFQNNKGVWVTWNPEASEMPYELLQKITILGQPRPELLKKYLILKS